MIKFTVSIELVNHWQLLLANPDALAEVILDNIEFLGNITITPQ